MRLIGSTVAAFALLAGCGSATVTSTEVVEGADNLEIEPEDVVEAIESAEVLETAEPSGSIETWLVEVGNDFPDEAKCVAGEMSSYSVADFEKSFNGEINEPFESELDAAYTKCDSALGITTEE